MVPNKMDRASILKILFDGMSKEPFPRDSAKIMTQNNCNTPRVHSLIVVTENDKDAVPHFHY